jgi:alpha-amylase
MDMKRKIIIAVAGAAIALCWTTLNSVEAGVLMQGFYRDASVPGKTWWDHLADQAHALRSAGFTAIWIPPVLKGDSGGLSAGYDPFDDYDIGSKDQQDTNHRNGDESDKNFRYKDAFGKVGGGRFGKTHVDFHRDDKKDQDRNVPNDDTSFGRDLKHDSNHVATGLKQAGDWLTKALDVQGYRLDYVKGISFTFLRDYLNTGAMAGKFAVGEFKESKRDIVDNWCRNSMQGRAAALDFGLRDKLKDMCDGHGLFNMRDLDHAGLAGINPLAAVTFVESHDTDEKNEEKIISNKHLAYAYILTSEGYPVVFYRDYFDFGMRATIDNLVFIHEKIASGDTRERFKDDDVFAYERVGGSHLLAAINDNGIASRTITVSTGFGPNTQLHDYTGHSGDVFTDGGGNITITIPQNSYVAYSRTGLDGGFHIPQFAVTQEFAGAPDLDIKPADNTQFIQVGRVFAQARNEIRAELFYDASNWLPATRIELELDEPSTTKVASLSRTAANGEFGEVRFVPTKTGWHTFRIRSFDTPPQNEKPQYWLKVRYTAPQNR